MSFLISTYSAAIDELDERQVYRYMGMGAARNIEVAELLRNTLPEFLNTVSCKACYCTVSVSIDCDVIDLGVFSVKSSHLARNLRGCEEAIVFAATLGIGTEQQKRRVGVSSPVKALVLDAMGNAAIEKFCDLLYEEIQNNHPAHRLRPRFSPGYGDFPLEMQKQLLSVLDAQRKIGVSMSSSLLMVPQKSVTAIIGIAKDGCINKVPLCDTCIHEACEFRL